MIDHRDEHAFATRSSVAASRRGSTYVLVLISAAIVTTLGLTSVSLWRVRHQRADIRGDLIQAQALARSGLEIGARIIQEDPNWAASRTVGYWMNDVPAGRGRITLVAVYVTDVAGGFNPNYPLQLTSIGRCGDCQQVLRSDFTLFRQRPYRSLQYAASAGSIECDGSIRTDADLASLDSDDRSESGIMGTAGNSPVIALYDPADSELLLPEPTELATYLSQATAISITSIPRVSGRRVISGRVLSSGSNPFGILPDLKGVYSIDCQGESVAISNSRIAGTLILSNAGSGSIIHGAVHMEPNESNYPALVILSGHLEIGTSGLVLSESTVGVNFNPFGTPYLGVFDLDTKDTYPSGIWGMVYVAGRIRVTGSLTVAGTLIAIDELRVDGTLTLDHNPGLATNPPPGFAPSGNPGFTIGPVSPMFQ